jgi:hypothetical protein
MPSPSNPAIQANANVAAYIKMEMDLLGDRDPFEVQEELLLKGNA